jgi:hypothetical protein
VKGYLQHEKYNLQPVCLFRGIHIWITKVKVTISRNLRLEANTEFIKRIENGKILINRANISELLFLLCFLYSICFRHQVRGSVRKSRPQSLDLRTERDQLAETLCSLVFLKPSIDRQCPKIQAISSVGLRR